MKNFCAFQKCLGSFSTSNPLNSKTTWTLAYTNFKLRATKVPRSTKCLPDQSDRPYHGEPVINETMVAFVSVILKWKKIASTSFGNAGLCKYHSNWKDDEGKIFPLLDIFILPPCIHSASQTIGLGELLILDLIVNFSYPEISITTSTLSSQQFPFKKRNRMHKCQ